MSSLSPKPLHKTFFKAADSWITPAQREAIIKFCTMQLTIQPQNTRRLAEDWFARVGLRFRIKPRLITLLKRASMGPVFGC